MLLETIDKKKKDNHNEEDIHICDGCPYGSCGMQEVQGGCETLC